MAPPVINLVQKLEQFSEQWTPKVIAQLGEYQFKLAKLDGEFVWHSHEETDETFRKRSNQASMKSSIRLYHPQEIKWI